jgi:hypothetical protein
MRFGYSTAEATKGRSDPRWQSGVSGRGNNKWLILLRPVTSQN